MWGGALRPLTPGAPAALRGWWLGRGARPDRIQGHGDLSREALNDQLCIIKSGKYA